MKFITSFILSLVLMNSISAQKNISPYQFYNAQGKKVSFKKVMKEAAKSDILFFGELHNNPICHWLQMEVVKDLKEKRNIQIGAEMFERDNEADLQRYMRDEINREEMDSLVRLWNNYNTDYAPLLEYAKTNGISYTGTNIPRRYASKVYRGDFEALADLTEEEKSWIAPLPIAYEAELKPYKDMLSMMGGHGGETLPKAQAIKDATMAFFILQERTNNNLFIHLNGSYHSDYFSSILWYIEQSQPELSMLTLSTVIQADINKLEEENIGKAHFILVVDEDMTSSY